MENQPHHPPFLSMEVSSQHDIKNAIYQLTPAAVSNLVRQIFDEIGPLTDLAIERVAENTPIYGIEGWNNHGAPEKLIRDIQEELADAIVYEIMRMRHEAMHL